MKKILLFISLFFISIVGVKADINIYETNLSSAIYTNHDINYTVNPSDIMNIEGTTFIGFYAPPTTTRQIYYFNNLPIDKYDILDFNIFVGNLSYVSSTTHCEPDSYCYNASFDNVPPLVILGGNMCSVVSLGHTNYYGDTGYNYQNVYHAQCKTYNSKANNIQILYIPPNPTSSSNVYFGISDPIIMSSSEDNTLKEIDETVKDLNDNITDDSIDSSDSTINNLNSKIPTNSVISDLLLLPVRFLQNFVNALGSSCSQFSLGSLYGTELFMPCINIENYLGSGIWTTIDLIISGLFIYALRKKFIEIYENLTNLQNGGNEVD